MVLAPAGQRLTSQADPAEVVRLGGLDGDGLTEVVQHVEQVLGLGGVQAPQHLAPAGRDEAEDAPE